MTDLNYFSTTRPDSLASPMTNVQTSVVLTDGSTFPDPALNGGVPYSIIVGFGTDREEVCTVTAKPTASTLTVLRGQDNTPATAKNSGDTVVHGVSARDFKAISTKVDKAGDTISGDLTVVGATSVAGLTASGAVSFSGATDVQDLTVAGTATLAGDPATDLEAAPKQYVDAAVPIGTVIDYVGTVAPAGWHLCDGTAHGSAAYLAAFGSDSTPDLRGLFVRGAGSGLTNGQTGGAATVTLTAAQSGLPAHSHPVTVNNGGASHSHTIDPPNTGTSGVGDHMHGSSYVANFRASEGPRNETPNEDFYEIGQTSANLDQTLQPSGAHSHTVDIAPFSSAAATATHGHSASSSNNTAANATAAHENLPPFYVLTKIVKVV